MRAIFLFILCFTVNFAVAQEKGEEHYQLLLKKAKTFKKQLKYDSAIVMLDKAAMVSRNQKWWDKYAEAAMVLSDIYKTLKQPDKVDSVFSAGHQELFKVALSIPKIYARFIDAYHGFLLIKNDLNAILILYSNLLNTARRLPSPILRDSLAQESYYWLGFINYELEKLSESLSYMDSSAFLISRIYGDMHIKNVVQLTATSKVYQLIGDYAKAHLLLEQAHSIIETSNADPEYYAESYFNLGIILSTRSKNKSDLLEGLAYLEKGLQFISQYDGLNRDFLDYYQKEIAEVHFDLGDYERALKHIALSEAHWNKYYAPDYGPQAFILFAKSKILSRLKKYNQALETLDISTGLLQKSNSLAVADNYLLTGDIYRFMGKSIVADSLYQTAIEVLIPDFETEMVVKANIEPDETLFDGLIKKAEVNYQMYNQTLDLKYLNVSHDFYQMAVSYLTTTRKRFLSDYAKIDLSERTRNVYSDAIKVCVQLYALTGDDSYLNSSFSIADRNRYNTLLENIQNQQIHLELKISPQTRITEKDLRKDIYNAKASLRQFNTGALTDFSQMDSLKNNVRRAEVRFRTFLNTVEKEHPEYTQLKYGPINIDFTRLKSLLGDRDLMIQYFIDGPGTLYIFALSKDEIFYVEKAWSNDIEKQMRGFMVDQNSFDVEFAHEQYKLLLQDVLVNFPNSDRLIILPDQELSNLPFEALITSPVGNDKIRYLIEDYTVSYHYSANVLLNSYERRKPTRRFVAYAPAASGGQQNLHWARKEVNTLTTLFDGDLVMGVNATKDHFFDNAGQYDIIHLATHGVVNNDDPLMSKLYFSNNENSESGGVLFGYELFNTELTANLVTLGACETASGNILEGEGIWSLGHGFSYAGVPNIVMSLRKVSDQPTNDIITGFYQGVEDGLGYMAALRQAKLNYLKSSDNITSNPFFWSSFVFFGDIDQPTKSPGYIYWLILFPLLIVMVMFYFKKVISFKR